MTHTNSTQYPNWVCVTCEREYPKDTKHVKCQGTVNPVTKMVEHCGGYLIRWRSYQRKTG